MGGGLTGMPHTKYIRISKECTQMSNFPVDNCTHYSMNIATPPPGISSTIILSELLSTTTIHFFVEVEDSNYE